MKNETAELDAKFIQDVQNLPGDIAQMNTSSVQTAYRNFLNIYGYYYIDSYYVGGRYVYYKIISNNFTNSNISFIDSLASA